MSFKNLKMTLNNNTEFKNSNHLTEVLKQNKTLFISAGVTALLWLLLAVNIALLVLNLNSSLSWYFKNLIKINGFTLLIWTVVTFFSAIVSTYATNYLKGFKYHSRFMLLCLAFTASVMFLVMSNHILLFLGSWLLMGVIMSQLIGIDKNWGEAKEASKFALKYFLSGSLFLTLGVLLLAFYSNKFTIDGLSEVADKLPQYITIPSVFLVIAASLVQSAIYPFHRWLLSAMTAPTPASALMHAGFVNGAGILLTLFAPLLFASNLLTILFVVGGLTAIIAQFTKLLQINVKQKLACSTIAQMGFMIMQCGLGFFNAAVVHLILHGFYKAYLFLSSNEEVQQSLPKKPTKLKIIPIQAILVIVFGTLGAVLFTIWTGKGIQTNSGVFLTLIVAITVGQATYNIVKEQSLSTFQKISVPALLFIIGIGVYALFYKGVSVLMASMPMIQNPMPLSWPQIIFGVLFLIGFFIMKLEVFKKIPWLYVKLLNISQPYAKTVLMYKLK